MRKHVNILAEIPIFSAKYLNQASSPAASSRYFMEPSYEKAPTGESRGQSSGYPAIGKIANISSALEKNSISLAKRRSGWLKGLVH
jgi:hypothetical protein